MAPKVTAGQLVALVEAFVAPHLPLPPLARCDKSHRATYGQPGRRRRRKARNAARAAELARLMTVALERASRARAHQETIESKVSAWSAAMMDENHGTIRLTAVAHVDAGGPYVS